MFSAECERDYFTFTESNRIKSILVKSTEMFVDAFVCNWRTTMELQLLHSSQIVRSFLNSGVHRWDWGRVNNLPWLPKVNLLTFWTSSYDVHTPGGHSQVNSCGWGRGSASCVHPHRQLEPTDVILYSSQAKTWVLFVPEFRFWMEWKVEIFWKYILVI